MNYQDWERTVPEAITGDILWKMKAYRLSLFVCHIGWQDVTTLSQDRRTANIGSQLYRSLGSIGANIAEGYSRSGAKERAHFLEYALGSARESRDWYYKAGFGLAKEVVEHRINLLTEIIKLLLKMVPNERNQGIIREDLVEYDPDSPAAN